MITCKKTTHIFAFITAIGLPNRYERYWYKPVEVDLSTLAKHIERLATTV